MVLKYRATRITSLRSLKPGDHIRVSRMLYNHHMMVVKVINNGLLLRVIHYTGSEYKQATVGTATSAVASPSSFSLSNGADIAKVKEENIFIDPQEEKVELLEYDDPEVAVHQGQNAIRRARRRIGEKRFDFVFTNCESLINWAITEREETGQGEVAIVAGAAAAVGVVGLAAVAVATIGIPGLVLSGLAFAYGYGRGNKRQRDDEEDN